MSKFNTSKKRSSGTIERRKSSTKILKKNQSIQESVSNEILRVSKYFKKMESKIHKAINKDLKK